SSPEPCRGTLLRGSPAASGPPRRHVVPDAAAFAAGVVAAGSGHLLDQAAAAVLGCLIGERRPHLRHFSAGPRDRVRWRRKPGIDGMVLRKSLDSNGVRDPESCFLGDGSCCGETASPWTTASTA